MGKSKREQAASQELRGDGSFSRIRPPKPIIFSILDDEEEREYLLGFDRLQDELAKPIKQLEQKVWESPRDQEYGVQSVVWGWLWKRAGARTQPLFELLDRRHRTLSPDERDVTREELQQDADKGITSAVDLFDTLAPPDDCPHLMKNRRRHIHDELQRHGRDAYREALKRLNSYVQAKANAQADSQRDTPASNEPTFVVKMARLANTLICIAGELEDHENVDEDKSWVLGSGPPPAKPKRGPKYAIANVREAARMIFEAEKLAGTLPIHPLVREAKELLALAHIAIGQADVPAEMAMIDKHKDEAIACARNGLLRAWERCGVAMEVLGAKLRVAASDGLPDAPKGAAEAPPLTVLHDEAAETPTGQDAARGPTGPQPLSADSAALDVDDDSHLGSAKLAELFKVPANALRKRLDHWRATNGIGYIENSSRKPRDPKYLYRVGTVRPIIEVVRATSETTSERPAKKN